VKPRVKQLGELLIRHVDAQSQRPMAAQEVV
jgi:hypothetical protein